MSLKFDMTFFFRPNIENGLDEKSFERELEGVKELVENLRKEPPGFVRIVLEDSQLMNAKKMAKRFGHFRDFDDFVVVGIGGSALGNKAVRDAICGPEWNDETKEGRRGFPRIHIIDNVDPDFVGSIMEKLNFRKTFFNVISKSGKTVETVAVYMIVRGIMDSLGVDPREHMLITTDPDAEFLREVAESDGIPTLYIPKDVGGRFSVLSVVGLVSAEAGGVNTEELRGGALKAYDDFLKNDLKENHAIMTALSYYLFYRTGKNVNVMMAYSNRLLSLAEWFRQLLAESLGKKFDTNGNKVEVGPTPVMALGATDQHSQIQLYNEGPKDKIITFLRVDKHERCMKIPRIHENFQDMVHLCGKTLGELINAEQKATSISLALNGVPNMTISFDEINEKNVGEFFMTYELMTVIMGGLLGVNPFDQPGVEMGKKLTHAIMGSKAHKDYLDMLRKVSKRMLI